MHLIDLFRASKISYVQIQKYSTYINQMIQANATGILYVFMGYDLEYLRYSLFLQAVLVSLKIYSEPYYVTDSICYCRNHTKNFLRQHHRWPKETSTQQFVFGEARRTTASPSSS